MGIHSTILLPLISVTLNVLAQAPLIYTLLEALKGFAVTGATIKSAAENTDSRKQVCL